MAAYHSFLYGKLVTLPLQQGRLGCYFGKISQSQIMLWPDRYTQPCQFPMARPTTVKFASHKEEFSVHDRIASVPSTARLQMTNT